MKKKILVAEDQDDLRGLLHMLLERSGYQVIPAADGQEAVEKAFQESPDLVLLDISMPKVDGVTALKLIRQRHPHVLAVAYTAYVTAEDVRRYQEAGFDEVLPKPSSIHVIREVIGRLVSQGL